MKKHFLFALAMMLCLGVMGQQSIQLRSADRAECVSSDYQQLKATFSFGTIAAENMSTERGQFSWLSMANTVIGGNEGDPQIPVVNELIAVPFGAQPRIEITGYSTTDYRLEDYGMHRLVPRQPSLRKDKQPEEVPFVMNEAAYQTRGFRSEPMAVVNVVGTMRGVQLGKMTIEPVSYDPINNTIRVFNDIEVTIHFDGADRQATEDMLVKTYSPYFDIVYKSLFNDRMVRDAYSQHPDLYATPVKMLVVTTSTYATSTAFQNWLTWKKQKGIDVDVQTVANSASASTIKSTIYSRYNATHPTFLVIVGDETVVTYYSLWDYDSSYGNAATDLEYASVDGDVYHDMFISRMPVSSTTELGNLVNKILTYEKYTMADPSYLDETLLIAGWDSSWTNWVGKPTINYAANNYFNTAHGITPHTFITTASGQTTCYNYINNVGFINYTAHGDIQKWHDPQWTNSNVNSMTNNDKYFWAMGNCCLTANFKNAQNSQTCFGEAMVRAANKGAFGYIGSVPESYWFEDFYFGVGAFNAVQGTNNPTVSGTTKGCYDAMFHDTGFNTLNSVPYIGNVAVTYAHAANYNSSVSDEYYWRAYQCFGDGSVMPYLKNPSANNVSHTGTLPIGATSYTVSADARSYVSITVNNEIIGVAEVPAGSTSVNVPVTAQSAPGTAMIVVTRQQRQPYIGSINIVGGNQYNITVNQPQHGTISAPAQAYASATVTLSATPEAGYCLSSWTVKKGNTNIPVTNNQFTMPEGDVTVTATFVQGMAVTLASVMHGTISTDTEYALQGTTINLTATPANNYVFDSWVVYKTGDVNTTVTVTDNSFTMPNYPVTVSAIFNEVVANDVTIGSGTTTNNGQYLPTYAYYNFSLTQQIYTSSEVGSAGAITKVAFKVSNSKSTSRDIDIYMSHTSTSSFSGNTAWIAQSTSYRVFSGSVNFNASGWTTITLDTPFEYNGTSNLLLTVDDNTGSYVPNSSDSPQFYTYSGSNNSAIYKYNDDTNYNPASMSVSGSRGAYKNQIMLTKEVPSTNGYLSVSPASLSDFNAVAGGAPSDPQSIAIVGNNLQANLTVTAPTGYQVSATQNGTYNTSLTLTPNNGSLRTNVFVRLGTNANPGEYNGNLTLASGTATATVNLSGTVIPGNVKYPVTLTANPSEGGSLTGAGEYSYNTSITVTATANTGYTFYNWTLNGEVVSTNASYSFNVTEATDLVANFNINSYTVTATPSAVEAGSVTVGNRNRDGLVYGFEDGTTQGWTMIQGSNGDSPNNWMHCVTYGDYSTGYGHNGSNGFVLSESYMTNGTGAVHPDNYLVSPQILLGGSISFWATDVETGYSEHFAVAVSTNGNTVASDFTDIQEWTMTAKGTGGTRSLENGTWREYTVDLSEYVGLGYVAIHHFDCYDQWLLCIDDITIVEGEPYTGAVSATFNHGETCTVTATANEGYAFVNWTENGQEVSTSASYNFVVTGVRTLVANFEASTPIDQQTIELEEGWNWWSTNLLITLDDLKTALGSNGLKIEAQNGRYVTYNVNSNTWSGNLTSIEIGVMYKISTSSACTITVSAEVADPSEHAISIYRGNSWIGFISDESMTLNQAFSNFTPTDRDVIKSANNGKATYYQGYGWRGALNTLEPGQGYIYKSNATTTQTFTYPSAK